MTPDTKPTRPVGQTPEQEERLRKIAEQQGTLHTSRIENILGAGKDLWETDEEFEQFMRLLREIRQSKG